MMTFLTRCQLMLMRACHIIIRRITTIVYSMFIL